MNKGCSFKGWSIGDAGRVSFNGSVCANCGAPQYHQGVPFIYAGHVGRVNRFYGGGVIPCDVMKLTAEVHCSGCGAPITECGQTCGEMFIAAFATESWPVRASEDVPSEEATHAALS